MTPEGSPGTARGAGLLSLRIDLPQGRIGPGKIGREGSISAAGRALGMSYKRG
jgi:molybdate transport system regulatory protein